MPSDRPSVDVAKLRAWTQRSIDRLAQRAGRASPRRAASTSWRATGASRATARSGCRGTTRRRRRSGSSTRSWPRAPGPRRFRDSSRGPVVGLDRGAGASPPRPGGSWWWAAGYIGLELGSVYAALGSRGHGRGAPGRDPPGRRPGSGRAAGPPAREALQADPARDQGHGGARRRERGRRWSSRARERRQRSRSTRCWWPWAAAPSRTTSGSSTRASCGTRAASSWWTRSVGPRIPACSPSGTWRASRCWLTRRCAEGLVAAEAAAGQPAAFEPLADSGGRVHRSRGRVVRADGG